MAFEPRRIALLSKTGALERWRSKHTLRMLLTKWASDCRWNLTFWWAIAAAGDQISLSGGYHFAWQGPEPDHAF